MPSEIQTSVAGGFGDRSHATVVGVATAVEHDGGDTGGLGAFGDEGADALGGGDAAAGTGGTKVGFGGRRRSQGAATLVVDHLCRDVLVRTVDGEARTLRGATDVLAHPAMAANPALAAGLGDVTHELLRSLLAGLAGFAQDALPGVPDALALVGLGLADPADVGGNLADDFLVDAVDDDLRRHRHLEGDPLRSADADRMAEAQVEPQRTGALGLGTVSDADDLEVLLEA